MTKAARSIRRPTAAKKAAGKRGKGKGAGDGDFWRLRLYVAGQTARSLAAIANLKKICEEHMAGKYSVEVIDLIKNPKLAAGDQILAIPTLVRQLPKPMRKIIGDLSNTERVLVGLDLRQHSREAVSWRTEVMAPKAPKRDSGKGDRSASKYVLRLYVTGITPRSKLAIENVRTICEEHLKGRYDLEVVDIYQQPTLAKGEQIIAAPTLVKKLPLPLRRFIGDMSQTDKILLGLDLRKKG